MTTANIARQRLRVSLRDVADEPIIASSIIKAPLVEGQGEIVPYRRRKPLRTAKAKWCAACGAGDEASLDSDAIPFTRAELIDVLNAHLALTAALTLLDVSLGHQFMVAKTKVRSVDQQPGFAEGLMLKFFSMGMHESTRMGHRIAEPRQLGMPTISDGLDDAFPPRLLSEAIDGVQFGIDLSHLR